MDRCEVCSKPFEQAATGRKRLTCSDRCKEKKKRRKRREENRASWEQARNVQADDSADVSGAPACHVCGVRPAVRGVPVPIICEACAA